jgi:glycosyltransferase involved in cell wall biosynthesis
MGKKLRGLLIYPISIDHPGNRGILNKTDYQARAFSELGADVDVMCSSRRGPVVGGRLAGSYPLRGRGFDSLNHYGLFYVHARRQVARKPYDFLYIRYPLALPSFLSFLHAVRKAQPELKIVSEIATYPYRRELDTPKRRVLLALDVLGRAQLKRYLDRIVTFYGQSEIHGVPCLRLRNGIDVDRIRMRRTDQPNGQLVLVSVGNVAERHGLDRVVRGLASFRDDNERVSVRLDVVGDGPAVPRLRSLAKQLGVGDAVRFLGLKHGAELDAIFDEAHLALDSLAIHRLDLPCSSSLKAREYCARGIPFVIASLDPDFPDELGFVYRAPANDEPLDIPALLRFHASVAESRPNVTAEMRSYAEKQLTWTTKLEPLFEYLYARYPEANR